MLVLDVAPFTAEGREPVGAHRATAVSHGMLEHELPRISVAYGVVCMFAAEQQAQAAER